MMKMLPSHRIKIIAETQLIIRQKLKYLSTVTERTQQDLIEEALIDLLDKYKVTYRVDGKGITTARSEL